MLDTLMENGIISVATPSLLYGDQFRSVVFVNTLGKRVLKRTKTRLEDTLMLACHALGLFTALTTLMLECNTGADVSYAAFRNDN